MSRPIIPDAVEPFRFRTNYLVIVRAIIGGQIQVTNQTPRNRPVFTPSKLNLYRRCPHQYYLQYVARVKKDQSFEPARERGIAMHSVLAQAFSRFAYERAFPLDLRSRIEHLLPAVHYTELRAWEADVDLVFDWVTEALKWFDGAATVLSTEKDYDRILPARDEYPEFTLRAKVDLVLEHPDGWIEIVDFKSGASGWVDEIQNVATRCVVAKAYPTRSLRNTVVFTQAGRVYSDVLSPEQIREVGAEIRRLTKAIGTDDQWLPMTNPLCDYCPFIDRCPLYADDLSDSDLDWLDAVA